MTQAVEDWQGKAGVSSMNNTRTRFRIHTPQLSFFRPGMESFVCVISQYCVPQTGGMRTAENVETIMKIPPKIASGRVRVKAGPATPVDTL